MDYELCQKIDTLDCVVCRVKAYRVYQEAVKYGYGNWNIWENYLVVIRCLEWLMLQW